MRKLNEKIEKILNEIVEKLKDNFKEGLCGVLLYGSWATGKARETSDIDLLVVFEKVTGRIRKSAYEVIGDVKSEMEVSIVLTSREEFQKEKIPLFTAVKKEGILLYGDLDLRLNPSPPEEKYKEFFRKSKEFEKRKVENAEKLLEERFLSSSVILNCYIAVKHAFQAGLAMKGIGFSSKFPILCEWVRKYYGEEWKDKFKKLFDLYVKSEYELEELSKEECSFAINCAKEILERVYEEFQEK